MNKNNEKSGDYQSLDLKKIDKIKITQSEISEKKNEPDSEITDSNAPFNDDKKKKSISIIELEEKMNDLFEFKLNEITNRIYFKEKLESSDWMEANENDIYLKLHKQHIPATIPAIKILLGSSFIPRLNPLLEYFKSNQSNYNKEKHGDYISHFLSFCNVDDPEFFSKTFKVWIVNAVQTVFETKAFNKMIFVFFNTKQNSGKTSFARFIIPDELREYFMENQLDATKDGIITLTKSMIHLLDEMAVISQVGFQTFKALVSKDKVDVRHPYGLNIISKPRLSSFLGTSDQFGFLNEDVGTARFIVHEVKAFNFNYSKKIIPNILWAQAYFHYINGEFLELTIEDRNKIQEINKRYIRTSYLSECISEILSPSDKINGQFMQTMDIVKLLHSKYSSIGISDRKIGDSLNSLGFTRIKHYCSERKNSYFGFYVKIST